MPARSDMAVTPPIGWRVYCTRTLQTTLWQSKWLETDWRAKATTSSRDEGAEIRYYSLV